MLTLHLEANTFAELKAMAEQAFVATVSTAAVPIPPTAQNSTIDESTPSPAVESKKRGRPAKNQTPVPEALEAKAVSEPQAQVGNSASESPATPSGVISPAEASKPDSAAPTAASTSSVVTFEDMKAALHKVAAKRDDDNSDDAGLMRASDIIGRFGYRKIKEVAPDKFADVIALCNADLARA